MTDCDTDPSPDGGDPPPLARRLRRAALTHLERYASSEAGLRRVLGRRLERWTRDATEEARLDAPDGERLIADAVEHCRRLGLLDDRAFAESKMASARRKGHSTRRIAATLAAKGIDRDVAARVLDADETDPLVAAVTFARRMRFGPFRIRPPADLQAAERREVAALCRNGHAYGVARRAVTMDHEEAAAILSGDGSGA